jgi:hypothetical protein
MNRAALRRLRRLAERRQGGRGVPDLGIPFPDDPASSWLEGLPGESRAELIARVARGKLEDPAVIEAKYHEFEAEREGRPAQVSPYWWRMEPAMERWLTGSQQRAEGRTYGFPDGHGDGEDGGAR